MLTELEGCLDDEGEVSAMATVTVGIPAFNEERTIHSLLQQVSSQRDGNGVEIREIVVLSDGSTDGTSEIVQRLSSMDDRIRLSAHERRQGMSAAVNDIFRLARSDILLVMNADASLDGSDAIARIGRVLVPVAERRTCTVDIFPAPATTLVGKAGYFSAKLRSCVVPVRPFYSFRVCFGLTRPLFSKMRIPDSVIAAEAYVFLKCLQMGAIVTHLKDVRVSYHEPSTLRDFLNMRIRYQKERQQLRTLFGDRALAEAKLSGSFLIATLLRCARSDPLSASVWLMLSIVARLSPYGAVTTSYEVASSTKRPFPDVRS
jgi:glycosyltransferase involved in cell wall biosynthesis